MSNSYKDKNTKVFGRIFGLWARISYLVLNGRRDPELVATELQRILDVREFRVPATDGKSKLTKSSLFRIAGDVSLETANLMPKEKTLETLAVVCNMPAGTYLDTMVHFQREFLTLCWEESQVVAFCENWPEVLRTDDSETFFFFRRGGKVYVAAISLDEDCGAWFEVWIDSLDSGAVHGKCVSGGHDNQIVIPAIRSQYYASSRS